MQCLNSPLGVVDKFHDCSISLFILKFQLSYFHSHEEDIISSFNTQPFILKFFICIIGKIMLNGEKIHKPKFQVTWKISF